MTTRTANRFGNDQQRDPRQRAHCCWQPNVWMVRLDSGHWFGWCEGCELEAAMHWRYVSAIAIWNATVGRTGYQRRPPVAAPLSSNGGGGVG